VPISLNNVWLAEGDVGLHNLALDPEIDTVNGIFDYDSAAWSDRHHDFRYLLLMWIAEICWIPQLRFMGPPRVDRSVAIASGSTMPHARSAIWHSE
jgi:aminoglycoside phosphotransferase (APT) family kinase protein